MNHAVYSPQALIDSYKKGSISLSTVFAQARQQLRLDTASSISLTCIAYIVGDETMRKLMKYYSTPQEAFENERYLIYYCFLNVFEPKLAQTLIASYPITSTVGPNSYNFYLDI